MAEPILLELPTRDPRQELIARLSAAPIDHAKALLAGYEVIQGLYDCGLLELARGALGAGEEIAQTVVDVGNQPESLRALRNVLLLAKLAASIDPEALEQLVASIPRVVEAVETARKEEPPGVLQSLQILVGKNFRRTLAAADAGFSAMFGSEQQKQP